MLYNADYPLSRGRRLRLTKTLRDLVSETSLSSKNLVQPLFVSENDDENNEVEKMPGIFRIKEKKILKEIELIKKSGINVIALFPKVNEKLKNEYGSEALNNDNLICRCIRKISREFPEMIVVCDVALDAYTTTGHDGIIDNNGYVNNDKSINQLAKMALNFAQSGSVFLAPSDMMDGRVRAIRSKLEENNFKNVCIMSYSAKYCSNLFDPFRQALGSEKNLGNSGKETYQMDFRNSREAIKEAILDINEGADIIMVKPASFYLDIIKEFKNNFVVPIAAFQVSGEYSMIKLASEKKILNYKEIVLESLFSIKRAGASIIFTYFAREVSEWLNN